MAGANFYLTEEPAQYEIHTELVLGNVGMIYNSSVLSCGTDALWEGEARIYTMGTYFYQECVTQCDSEGSMKGWRGKWSASENVSPATQVSEWLTLISQGIGYYSEAACVPSESQVSLSSLNESYYTVELKDQPINWAALCDAHPDVLFGGDEFLGAFTAGTVTLYFAAADHSLDAILISTIEDASWLEVTIMVSPAQIGPIIDLHSLDIVEGTLSEEWNMAITE